METPLRLEDQLPSSTGRFIAPVQAAERTIDTSVSRVAQTWDATSASDPVAIDQLLLLEATAVAGDVAAFHQLDGHHARAGGAFRVRIRALIVEAGLGLIASPAVDRQHRSNVALAMFDTLFRAGDWERVADALRQLSTHAEDMPTELILTLLGSTKPCITRVSDARAAFAERAVAIVRARQPDRAEQLLSFVL
jgi:hypothetical protein